MANPMAKREHEGRRWTRVDPGPRLGRMGLGRRAIALASGWLVGLAAGGVGAQVTVVDDDVDAPPDGSLRFEIESAGAGATVQIQIPSSSTSQTIALDGPLTFGDSLTLDNSSLDFPVVPILAPTQGTFLEIETGVSLLLRDVELNGNSGSDDDAIELQGATSVLTLEIGRADQTLAVDITGSGRLVKRGARVLELAGDNAIGGGIRIEQGDLRGDLDALTGGGDITLAPSGGTARVVFDVVGSGNALDANGPSILASESNGGRGIFVKSGAGELDLTGSGLVAGADIAAGLDLQVEDGTLIVGSAILGAGHDITLDSGGTLRNVSLLGADLSYSGALSGNGTFSHQSFDTLVLDGDLTGFTGLLDIQAGSIVDLEPGLARDASLGFSVNSDAGLLPLPGVLRVDNSSAFDLTLSGNLSGDLALRSMGSGVVRLTGNATHTAGTFVDAGTLVGNTNNLQRNITVAGGSSLHFDQSGNGTFSGSISHSGGSISVRKLGTGSLTLGTTQSFSGTFSHDDGGLVFGSGVGLPNANLFVGDGDATAADLSAAFDPNGSQAANTVAIGGSLTIRDDARVAVELSDQDQNGNPANRSTRYAATGAVTIGGTSAGRAPELVVRLQPGTFTGPGTGPYTVITGASITQNEPFTIADDLVFFDLAGGVFGNTYQVSLAPSGQTLESEASTHNQREVGAALDVLRAAGVAGDPELQTILENLNTITAQDVGPTLEAFSADTLSAATNVRLAAAARTWRGISNRLDLARGQSIGRFETRDEPAVEPSADPEPTPSVDAGPTAAGTLERRGEPWVAWLEAAGVIGDLGSDDSQGYGYKIIGPIFGADTALSDELRVGFAAAGTRYVYDGDGSNDKGVSNAVEGTLYGAWVGEPVEFLIGARYGHSWIETKRILRFDDLVNRVEGEFEGNEVGLYGELARAFGKPQRAELTPFASVAYSWIDFEDFDENGRSTLRMQVDGTDVHSAATSLGLRLTAERKMDDDLLIRPRLRAAWGHEWADVVREVNGEFVAGGGSLDLEGAEMPRDRAELSVGWEVGYTRNANLFVTWDGRFGEDLVENALSLGLRAAW